MSDGELERSLEALHPASFGWALACCRWDQERALEALQASYLKAIEGRARFNGRSSVRTWFFGVVMRTAAEQRRSRVVGELALGRWLRREPSRARVPTPEELSRDAEARGQLQELLNRLSRRQRELLHLVFYQELSIEEAAAVLCISIGSARRHYERGKSRLRELISRAGEATCTDETIATKG